MNLKAVAGVIRSPKTPKHLKEGLIKKYGSQLNIKNPKKIYSTLKEDICKTCKKRQTECICGEQEVKKSNPLAKWETPAMHKKVKRCVKNVSGKSITSPYAVCKASVKRSSNPGAAWHQERRDKWLQMYNREPNNYRLGRTQSHEESINESQKLGMNPKADYYIGISKTGHKGVLFAESYTPTRAKYGNQFLRVYGPFLAMREASKFAADKGINVTSFMRVNKVRGKKRLRKNPPSGTVEIYDRIEAIEAQKGDGSLWPKEKFRHSFKSKTRAKVFGNPDGSLTIRGKKPLWKNINYPGMSK